MTTDKQARKLKAELRVIRKSVKLLSDLSTKPNDIVPASKMVSWARDVLREAGQARKDVE